LILFIIGMLAEIRDRMTESTAEAFARLYDQFMPKVFRYINYRIVDAHTAEDLTSMVFEKALTKFKSYDSAKAGFSTWIFSIARNTLIDHYRTHKSDQNVPLENALPLSVETLSVEDVLTREEECQMLQKCVKELSAQEQEIISLKFGAEMTNREIAKMTGLSDSNVGTITFRAVRKLRDKFSRRQNGD
jgi:RNA polymerase sigma factor (sigma-70 family)